MSTCSRLASLKMNDPNQDVVQEKAALSHSTTFYLLNTVGHLFGFT